MVDYDWIMKKFKLLGNFYAQYFGSSKDYV